MDYTKGAWLRDETNPEMIAILDKDGIYQYIAELDPCDPPDRDIPQEEVNGNGELIVSAVNACTKINPENPQAVAGSIGGMYEALEEARITLRVLQPKGSAVLREIDTVLAKTKGK